MIQKIHCLPNHPDSSQSIICRSKYAMMTQQKRGKALLCGLSMAQEIENIFNMFSTFLRIIFATVHLYPRKRFSIVDMRETDFFCDLHIVLKI